MSRPGANPGWQAVPVELITPRLRLRAWRPDEAPRLLDLLGRMEVVRWLGDQGPILMSDLAQARHTIDRYAATFEPSRGNARWAVEVAATGAVAGTVLLAPLPRDPEGADSQVEVAWFLHPDSWGHGYATEAARAVLGQGFAWGLPELWALTHLDNEPSQAVCRRLGMTYRGRNDVPGRRWYAVPMHVFSITADQLAEPERAPLRP